MSRRTSSIIGGIGRAFIGAGLLVMAFALFQLWGTALQEERAQGELFDDFEARRALVSELAAQADLDLHSLTIGTDQAIQDTSQPNDEPAKPDETAEADAPQPQPEDTIKPPPTIAPELAEALIPRAGQALGRIEIPKIGVDKAVVQGVRRADLRDGPGHYPDSVYPGQAGNAAIAGHRTTYGSPFGDLDLLEPGDTIRVETVQGEFYYEVLPQTDPATGRELGHKIVTPYEVDVLDDHGDNRLTLTACHPKYSARQRIVVAAVLISDPADFLPELAPQARPIDNEPDGMPFDEDPSTVEFGDQASDTTSDGELTADDFEASLGWQSEELPGVLLWAFGTFLVGLGGYILDRKWRRIPAYAATSVPFLVMLWVCFEHLDRLLPAF